MKIVKALETIPYIYEMRKTVQTEYTNKIDEYERKKERKKQR